MKLIVSDIYEFENPSDKVISQYLSNFSDPQNDSFAILEIDDYTYIQCCLVDSKLFTLEYQDGSVDEHFQAVDDITLDLTIKAFIDYKNRSVDWSIFGQWKKIPI
jgi:hypothetical protein